MCHTQGRLAVWGYKGLDQGKSLSQEPREQNKWVKKEEEGFQDSWEMKRRTD
jgi:hypothetical protein